MSAIIGATKSKTMWVAAAVTVGGALLEFLPQVQALIPPTMYGKIIAGLGLVMAILRVLSTQSLSDKGSS